MDVWINGLVCGFESVFVFNLYRNHCELEQQIDCEYSICVSNATIECIQYFSYNNSVRKPNNSCKQSPRIWCRLSVDVVLKNHSLNSDD